MNKQLKTNKKSSHLVPDRDWRPVILVIMIIIATFALYGKSLNYDYTYLDDNELILKNKPILEHISNIPYAFMEDVFFSYSDSYYRPMLTLSFMLDAQFGNDTLFSFHLSNLIIHMICAFLVFVLIKKLGRSLELAAFFAVLFTVHPVLSQAVAWVPGRNDSLLALFVLTSFIMLIKYLEKMRWRHYFLHILLFTMALFTKETVLLFVFVALGYIFLLDKPANQRSLFLRLFAGWGAAAVLYLFMRTAAMIHPIEYSLKQMILSTWISVPALFQFLGKIFFPFNLSVLPTMLDTTYLFGLLAILVLVVIVYFQRKRADWLLVGFGGVWFLMFIIPSFIRPNADIMVNFLEHRTYLPIIGIFIILSGLWRQINLNTMVVKSMVGLILMTMGIVTWFHVPNFQNRLTFWKNAANNSPHSPLAQRNLGAMLYLDNDKKNAAILFQKALDLNPTELMANMNLGLIAMDQNNLVLAESLFVRELAINPFYSNAYFNLGLLYYKKGVADKAAALWEKTLQMDSNFTGAYYNLIVLFYENQKIDVAKSYMRTLRARNLPVPRELEQLIGY